MEQKADAANRLSWSFNAKSHSYFIGDLRVPGVSEVLRFAGGGIDRETLDAAALARVTAAANRGLAVHEATRWIDQGLIDAETYRGSELWGFLQCWEEFKRLTGFQSERIEQSMVSFRHRFGGTVDRTGSMRAKPGTWVVDLKSGQRKDDDHAFQGEGYQEIADEHGWLPDGAAGVVIVYLRADGRLPKPLVIEGPPSGRFVAKVTEYWKGRESAA